MKTLFLVLSLLLLSTQSFAQSKTALAAPLAITATGTSTQVVGLNFNRKYLLIQNNGSASVFIKPGLPHTGTEGIVLVAGGVWEPSVVPVDSIFLKASTGSQACVVQEGN